MTAPHTNLRAPRSTPHAGRAAARVRAAQTRLGLLSHIVLPPPCSHCQSITSLIGISEHPGRTLLDGYGVYLRSCSLGQQICSCTNNLAFAHGLVVDHVRAIAARFLVASSTVPAPTHPNPVISTRIRQAWADPALANGVLWPDPTEVFVLDPPLPNIAIPLGSTRGMRGVRHRSTAALLTATQVKGLPAI